MSGHFGLHIFPKNMADFFYAQERCVRKESLSIPPAPSKKDFSSKIRCDGQRSSTGPVGRIPLRAGNARRIFSVWPRSFLDKNFQATRKHLNYRANSAPEMFVK